MFFSQLWSKYFITWGKYISCFCVFANDSTGQIHVRSNPPPTSFQSVFDNHIAVLQPTPDQHEDALRATRPLTCCGAFHGHGPSADCLRSAERVCLLASTDFDFAQEYHRLAIFSIFRQLSGNQIVQMPEYLRNCQ